ncbi:hypothetical protein GCM10009425_39920 [Pseudomonas asuensis]|uniref:Uncharacterized protein n=1 Tax=Pseudomonas asuensis TaxID=1825787 RepID=A0ABQ2H1A0_9PSED|nr:hypothetical protein GCM10009425_39920 [Pseudomonas asuensis]
MKTHTRSKDYPHSRSVRWLATAMAILALIGWVGSIWAPGLEKPAAVFGLCCALLVAYGRKKGP